jgi:hypothetical protein
VIMGQDNSMSICLYCILQYDPGIYDTPIQSAFC